MQITGDEIIRLGFLSGTKSASIRPAGYDLTTKEIIVDGKRCFDQVSIPPQSMFVVISNEVANIPAGYAAYALPKTSLCQRGILPLNTGILDPGYSGPISTVAINFNSKEEIIYPDDAFLRLVFHKLNGEGSSKTDDKHSTQSHESYIRKRQQESINFPNTFLDIGSNKESLVGSISSKLFKQQIVYGSLAIAIIAIAFSFFAIAVNDYSQDQYISKISDSEEISNTLSQIKEKLEQLEANVSGVEKKQQGLEK